ncbi:hypothetical protein EDB81DRAFT_876866 [Dactylonectria macrodidyma]|uniref:Uncharacterized protein n=1 Tax=Dactylonectria macrodidyma TaxID=307937 RepID=A0A9P9FR65_9HYPO|nr:hypothetical protein EDB81DRAFT_876866 [Dactylonectria macrodidyma]
MYSQSQLAFVPAPQLVQIPQYAATPFVQPAGAYPQTVPQKAPRQDVPQQETQQDISPKATQQAFPRQAVQHATLEPQDKQLYCASTGWADSSGPFSQQLECIQMEIDQKMALLARKPQDPALRADLRKLQDQLNFTLNAAIARNRKSKDKALPQLTAAKTAQLGGDRGKSNEVVDGCSVGEARPSHSEGHVSTATLKAGRYPKGKRAKQGFQRSEQLQENHICSGCGCVRSSQFHDKHPYTFETKRVPNYCKICRTRKIARGVVGSRHFCFGCGQVRSKSFQREHPILPGDPMLPNFCIICMNDLRAEESLAEASVLDLDLETGTNQGSVNGSTEDDNDSLRAHISRGKEKHKCTTSFSDNEGSQHDLAQEEVRARRHRPGSQTRRRTNPSSFDANESPPKHDDSPSLRHSLGRLISSAERGAQSSPPGRAEKNHGRVPTEEAPRKYKAPFVEESKSATQTPERRSRPGLSPTNDSWKRGETGVADGCRDSSLPAGVDKEFEPSDNSSQAKRGGPFKGTTQRDKSADSDLSAGSRKSSLKSSGSKTVRFKQSVDIQTPCEPGFKHDKSPIRYHHLETEGNGGSENPQLGSSPLFYNRTRPQYATTRDDKHSARHYFGRDDARSSSYRPTADGNNFQTHSSIPWGATSPGFSQGAFSRGFNSPEESPRGTNGFGSHGSPSGKMNEFPRKSSHGGYADEFSETPKSFRTSGFGSFFNKHGKNNGGKGTGPSASMASSPPPYDFKETARDHWEAIGQHSSPNRAASSSPDDPNCYSKPSYNTWTAFADPEYGYFAEDEFMFQDENENSRNPYYTRQRWGFASSSEWSHGKESEETTPSWKARRTTKRWSQSCDAVPEPIIEEASSVEISPLEICPMKIEYTVTDSSSESETSDATEFDEFTSDEEVDEEDIITEGAMRLLKSGAKIGPQRGI